MYWVALQPQPEPGSPESQALPDPAQALAWWALQFTPRVARLQDAVLLEISGSARLWGGQAALLRHIYTSNKPVAQVQYARGATSLVAYGRLLAGARASFPADQLPLSALLAAQPHLATLVRLGCSTWGELRALPRGGLARRFGATLVDALDQAYGARPDVYPWLALPEVFEARLDLLSHTDNAPSLLFGARRLLAQLQLWLQLRQLGVLAIELGWTLDARRNTDSQGALVIRTAHLTQDIAHLQRLLAERLAQLTLPAPAQGLRLRSLQTQTLKGQSASLLPDAQASTDSLTQTLERLSARLGAAQVLRLQTHADHRPEQVQTWVAATATSKTGAGNVGDTRAKVQKQSKKLAGVTPPASDWVSALLPTWLLAQPLPLAVHQHQAHYHGPLTLLSGPQRLEAGWWPPIPETPRHTSAHLNPSNAVATQPDRAHPVAERADGAQDRRNVLPQGQAASPVSGLVEVTQTYPGLVLRDYFVARSANSPLLWIYRERLGLSAASKPSAAWYLHGIFA